MRGDQLGAGADVGRSAELRLARLRGRRTRQPACRRATRSSRCTTRRTRRRSARSSAATWCATRACRASTAATSTATTATRRSGSAAPRTGARRRRDRADASRTLTSFGEDACGRVYAAVAGRPGLPHPGGGERPARRRRRGGATDTSTPGVRVWFAGVKSALKKRRLLVRVRATEACRIALGTRLKKVRRLSTRHRSLAAGKRKTVKLKLSKPLDPQAQAPPVRADPGDACARPTPRATPASDPARPDQAALVVTV